MSGALLLGGILGTTFLLGACAVIPKPGPVGNRAVPEPEKAVDIRKYMGLWYEQFRYENAFEKHMDEVTARYVMNDNGTVRVINRGKTKQGKWKQSTGRARVTPNTEAAKLRVSFFFPFYGNYWILDPGSWIMTVTTAGPLLANRPVAIFGSLHGISIPLRICSSGSKHG